MDWHDVPPSRMPPATEIDPYLLWSLGPGLADFMLPIIAEQRLPLLCRLNAVNVSTFESRSNVTKRQGDQYNKITGRTLADRRPIDKDDPYRTVFLERDFLSELTSNSSHFNIANTVNRFSFGPPLNVGSV